MKQEYIDYYQVLGIDHSSTQQDIKKSFRQKAKRLHPDLVTGSETTDSAMKLLLKAYQVLSDPEKRREYDRVRKTIHKSIEFNYRDFLRKKTDDFYNLTKLVFYDLLHDNESDAVLLFEELVEKYHIAVDQYLGREDFMDCAFLLAEEYEKKREYIKAYELLIKIVLLEFEKPYFHHFLEEVIDRLRTIVCIKMDEKINPQQHIDYLLEISKFNVSDKLNAHVFKKVAELFVKLGKVDKARYYLKQSLDISPGISGVKKLKQKTAYLTS